MPTRYYGFLLYKLFKYKFNEYVHEYFCNRMTVMKITEAEFIAEF